MKTTIKEFAALAFMLTSFGLLLFGCGPSEAERRAAFVQRCKPAFNEAQCNVLFEIKEASDEAKSAANTSAALSGVAMGMSAGRK